MCFLPTRWSTDHGVHNPAISRRSSRCANAFGGWRVGIPASRSGRRSRGKAAPADEHSLTTLRTWIESCKTTNGRFDFGGYLQLYDSALQTDCDRVGSVVCTKLVKNACDVAFHGLFRDRKLCGDLFVRVSPCDQAKDVHFARCQLILAGMLGQLGCDFGRYPLLSGVDGADGLHQIGMHAAL